MNTRQADGLGSITSLTGSTGQLTATYGYDSFGNTTATEGIFNPYRYTAREQDPETGLYYYRARYYDPAIGRFLSEDPVRFWGGVDFYKYVDNNPVNEIDPSGEIKIHGNWCGPDWTGGRVEQYDPAHSKLYKPPVDAVDSVCETHDKCYYQARKQYPCDKEKRRVFMEQCDAALLADIPKNTFWGQIVQAGIEYHPADPGPDAPSCSCKK